MAPAIPDAISWVVWTVLQLICSFFLQMIQRKDGAHIDFACAQQGKDGHVGSLTPVYLVA